MSNLLQKYLGKANEAVEQVTKTVMIDGDEWSVRKMNLIENRSCIKLAEKKRGLRLFPLQRRSDRQGDRACVSVE